MFFTKKHKIQHVFTTITRCDLCKNIVFSFETVISQCSEALLNWKIFFENEDTKGIWGENLVGFHF